MTEVESALSTQSSAQLLKALDEIVVKEGGDCPELALEGLLKGLEHALPKSMAFIITDATAKDYQKEEQVMKDIQAKQVTVNVISTGVCKGDSIEGYKVFERITKRSGGQVFNLKKDGISKVLEALKDILKPSIIDYSPVHYKADEVANTTVIVDASMSEICAIVSGEKASLKGYDPSFKEVTLIMKIAMHELSMGCVKDPISGKKNFNIQDFFN